MSRISSIAITTGLIGSGVLAWTYAARPLLNNPDLDAPLNPLGINRSPYGEVFAMAMQSPIDAYFHASQGEHHSHAPGDDCTTECSGDQESHTVHEHDEHCDHDHSDSDLTAPASPTPKPSLKNRFTSLLASLDHASTEYTNPRAASPAMKLHLRRKTEDKLRFAYNLDPSHYGNYNALHFFLSEPQMGTRPQLSATTAKLAEDTIQYCLARQDDPRPALTAAAACTNILFLMFEDHQTEHPQFNPGQMRHTLNLLDHCLNRHAALASQWDRSDAWQNLSAMRIQEIDARLRFITKIRDTADKTIVRLENEAQHQAANQSAISSFNH